MKKFLIFTFFILCSIQLLAQRQTFTKFEGMTITGASVNGAFDVRISQGEKTGITVNIADQIVSKLVAELNVDGIVRLEFGSPIESMFTLAKNRPLVTIVLSRLDYLYVNGASTVLGSGKFSTTGDFIMNINNSAFVAFVNIDCKDGKLSMGGTSTVEDFTINASTMLKAEVGGSAIVTFKGSAPTTKITSMNTSLVDMLGFNSAFIEATTTGTSLIKATVNGKAEVTIAGLSAFKYQGSGNVVGDKAKRL